MENRNRYRSVGDGFFSFTRSEILIKLILLFPITTLFQYHIGILNKALFFLVLAAMVLVSTLQRKAFAYNAGFFLLWAFSVVIAPLDAIKANFNMTFYYLFLVLFFVYVLTDPEQFWALMKKNRRYIYYVVLFYTAVVTLSIFLPSSYTQMVGWGEEAYFTSISGSPNRVGPASVFVVVLITFLIQTGSHKALALLTLPQLYVFLMGGSRTYFVVGLCTALVLFYVMIPRKKWFFLSLIPLGLVAVVVILNSSMMDKFASTFQQGVDRAEFWRRLTNSRSVFWVDQLKLFFTTPWYLQLFGNGINFTTYHFDLWAHNDFIEIVCSYGYVGLANYLVLMIYTIAKLSKTKKRHFFIKCVCIFIWFFNAFFNFFYCYFCAMLCYPILLLILRHMDDPAQTQAVSKG